MVRFANHLKRRAANSHGTPADRQQPRQAGFTIIEILIVLAIAGLMLLIVFEALPALERSSRNNQRRQDVQTILAAVSHYELNNSANIPDSATLRGLLAASPTSASKLNYYDPTSSSAINVFYSGLNTSIASMPAVTDLDTVNIYNHAKCNTNSPGAATHAGAGYSDVVALYAIESGSSSEPQCQQL